MKKNYQVILEETISEIRDNKIKPKLLLHSCCAPCSSYILEYLMEYFDITVFFYNPNMIDIKEYEKRYNEQVKINDYLSDKGNIKLVKVDYISKDFLDKVKGMEDLKEGSIRCKTCFEMRLYETAVYAKKNNFDYFTTTLSISPLKNSQLLNSIGIELGKKMHVNYLQSDFKKKNGYKRSVELSEINNLYRQDYCGCIFSKREREGLNLKKEQN